MISVTLMGVMWPSTVLMAILGQRGEEPLFGHAVTNVEIVDFLMGDYKNSENCTP